MEDVDKGAPKQTDFIIKEEELADLKDNEFLAEAVVWSVDPYNRAYADNFAEGTPMIGFQVAKIIESKSAKFPVGKHVVGHFGWRTHTVVEDQQPQLYLLPEIGDLPISLAVGVLGMPGVTAYFGFLDKCQPKEGETVVVNAAAGAVGSAVGQIAKIKGCKVIGYAGTDAKVRYLKKELGFDHAFNYKTVDLDESLTKAAPKGVDCFFDNVGGNFAVTVYEHLNSHARVCQCGCISIYNATEQPTIRDFLFLVVMKEISLLGFHTSSYLDKFPEAIAQMHDWVKQGKVKYRESEYHGFDSMPKALIDLLAGKTVGKAVIKKD